MAVDRAAIEFAAVTGHTPNLGHNDRAFLVDLVMTTGDHMIDEQKRRPDAALNSRAVLHIQQRVDAVRSVLPEIEDAWLEAFRVMGTVGVLGYLFVMGRSDLAEAFATAVQARDETPPPSEVPVEELLELLSGSQNIFDPEFRKRAPTIVAEAERVLKQNRSVPSDSDLVGDQGASERQPHHLSATAPGGFQRFTEADHDYIADLVLSIAGDSQPVTRLSELSALELEVAGAFAQALIKRQAENLTEHGSKRLIWVDSQIARELSSRPDQS